jgi:predicted nucleic acid-binding protein
MIVVADSSVWINHFRDVWSPQVQWLRSIKPQDQLIAGDLIVLEILRGADSDREAAVFQRGFQQMGIARMLDGNLAIRAAANYRRLRSLGITISKTVDLIIATYCIARGCALLHQDRDFLPFARHLGLRVVD